MKSVAIVRVAVGLFLFGGLGLVSLETTVWPAQEAPKPFETGAFGPDGTVVLVKAGSSSVSKIASSSRTSSSFSVTFKDIYRISLYLEEAGAQQAFAPFQGQNLKSVLKEEGIHRAVIELESPKAVVMGFSAETPAQDIHKDLNERFLHSAAYRMREKARFMSVFKGSYKPGDEVVILFLGDRVVVTAPKIKKPFELASRDFSRALLGIWLGPRKESGSFPNGLLSKIEPFLK